MNIKIQVVNYAFFIFIKIALIECVLKKVILIQHGYLQFMEYELDVPYLKHFTMCMWVKTYDVSNDHPIFYYVVNRNDPAVALWLETGGYYIKSKVGDYLSEGRVSWKPNVWHHVCFSWQSDFGAWAVYVNRRLINCDTTDMNLAVVPGGGKVMLGSGPSESGILRGMQGEIYGFNMILSSTIENNHTLPQQTYYNHPDYRTDNDSNTIYKKVKIGKSALRTASPNRRRKQRKKHNKDERSIMRDMEASDTDFGGLFGHSKDLEASTEMWEMKNIDIHDFGVTTVKNKIKSPQMGLPDLSRENIRNKHKVKPIIAEQHNVPTETALTLAEFETPPPNEKNTLNVSFTDTNVYTLMKPTTYFYELADHSETELNSQIPSEFEIPPERSTYNKVYGQWRNDFAQRVLKFLKSSPEQNIGYNYVPKNMPTLKPRDYSNIFNSMKKPFPYRKQIIKFSHNIFRRDVNRAMNVEVLKDDLREAILNEHQNLLALNVLLTHRSEERKFSNHNNDFFNIKSTTGEPMTPNIFQSRTQKKIKKTNGVEEKNTRVPEVLSNNRSGFESNQKFEESNSNKKITKKSKSSKRKSRNKNPKSVPDNILQSTRQMASAYNRTQEFQTTTSEHNKKLAIAHEINKLNLKNERDKELDLNFLNKLNLPIKERPQKNRKKKARNIANIFSKEVKLGNTLNERYIFGEESKSDSFVGGDDNIPDINRFRSDIDGMHSNVPPSLQPNVCNTLTPKSKRLIVHPDGSISNSNYYTPIVEKFKGVEFMNNTFISCDLNDGGVPIQDISLVLIDWTETPVRLYGGASITETIKICPGFDKLVT